jgi:hypothetical protein
MAGKDVLLSCLISSIYVQKGYIWLFTTDLHCMSCQCVACYGVSITKVLFACSDPVDVSLHNDLVVEAGRLLFRFYIQKFSGLC